MAIWKLTIEDDEGQKTVVPLVREEYSVGRKDGHAIRLTERNVSRDHARLRKQGESFLIEDLGSYNGVFVNGHRVAEATALHAGDLIIIGDYRIEAHNEEATAAVARSVAPAKAVAQPPVAAVRPAVVRVEKPNRLVVLSGTEAGREINLTKPKMMVGRGDDVDIRVNHTSVSRHHCEILTLDEGRYEAIDQGSANGIRLNGQDVKRAILAPGDLLELGDVQVKYVGAGQAFVFDAAAAEAAREIEMRNERQRRRSGVGTWALVVLLVAAAAAGGVVLARGNGTDRTASSASASTSTKPTVASDDPLMAALAMLEAGDPVGAYSRVKDRTAAKASPDYARIENAWAAKRLDQLEGENDVAARRAGLEEIQSSGADSKYRDEATRRLAALTAPPVPTETATVDAGKRPVPTATTTATAPTAKPTQTATAPTAKPTTTSTGVPTVATAKPTSTAAAPVVGNCPSYKGDYPGAAKAADWDCVRTMLLPRLNAGAISSGEARYLKAACLQLGDLSCSKRAAEKI